MGELKQYTIEDLTEAHFSVDPEFNLRMKTNSVLVVDMYGNYFIGIFQMGIFKGSTISFVHDDWRFKRSLLTREIYCWYELPKVQMIDLSDLENEQNTNS